MLRPLNLGEKFLRLSDQTPGSGLGLAISRAAVSVQGGEVAIRPGARGGACFTVSLPGVRLDT